MNSLLLALFGSSFAFDYASSGINDQLINLTTLLTEWSVKSSISEIQDAFHQLTGSINDYAVELTTSKDLDSDDIHQFSRSLADMLSELGNREVDFENSGDKGQIITYFNSIVSPVERLYDQSSALIGEDCTNANRLADDIENVSDGFSQVSDAFKIGKPNLPTTLSCTRGLIPRSAESFHPSKSTNSISYTESRTKTNYSSRRAVSRPTKPNMTTSKPGNQMLSNGTFTSTSTSTSTKRPGNSTITCKNSSFVQPTPSHNTILPSPTSGTSGISPVNSASRLHYSIAAIVSVIITAFSILV